MSSRYGRIVSLVGQSGSGKTTQIRELTRDGEYRVLPSVTTRGPRDSDLANEYRHVQPDEYGDMRSKGRFLWDVVAGNGDHYAKDICDIEEALTDPIHNYTNALVPSAARFLVEHYGTEVAKTVWLPSPGEDVLYDRLRGRGMTAEAAFDRLCREREENWLAQSLSIHGLYIVQGKSIADQHREIVRYAES